MKKSTLKLIGSLEPDNHTVLFIPGGLCSPVVYEGIEIPKGYQSAIVDWSRSEGPWNIESIGKRIVNLVIEKSLGPTVLVGYSAGGVIAMCSALESADKIAGLLISNTGANTKGHGDPHFPQKIVNHWGERDFIEAFLSRCFANPIPANVKTKMVEYIGTLEKQAAYEGASSLRQLDIENRISSIRCPVSIVHGVDDKARTREHALLLKAKMPHAKLVWLKGGHTIMVENREEWQAELHDLLQLIRG